MANRLEIDWSNFKKNLATLPNLIKIPWLWDIQRTSRGHPEDIQRTFMGQLPADEDGGFDWGVKRWRWCQPGLGGRNKKGAVRRDGAGDSWRFCQILWGFSATR